jgi:hypothetical protein
MSPIRIHRPATTLQAVHAPARLSARRPSRLGLVVLLVVIAALFPAAAEGAVSVSRAEVSGTQLKIEGTAIANRTITVDGVAMGYSGADGAFRLEQWGFVAPGDCTVDVNDGWAGPTVVRLSGCTVNRAR